MTKPRDRLDGDERPPLPGATGATRTDQDMTRRHSFERAVAPVVGVALLVGITVILASVVGSVVLGGGLGPDDTPEVTLSFAVTDDGEILLRHEGGDALGPDEVVVRAADGSEYGVGGELVAGDRELIRKADGTPVTTSEVDRVAVVWQGPSGGESVLATFEP